MKKLLVVALFVAGCMSTLPPVLRFTGGRAIPQLEDIVIRTDAIADNGVLLVSIYVLNGTADPLRVGPDIIGVIDNHFVVLPAIDPGDAVTLMARDVPMTDDIYAIARIAEFKYSLIPPGAAVTGKLYFYYNEPDLPLFVTFDLLGHKVLVKLSTTPPK